MFCVRDVTKIELLSGIAEASGTSLQGQTGCRLRRQHECKAEQRDTMQVYLSLGSSGQLNLAELHSLVQSYVLIDLRQEAEGGRQGTALD